MKGLKKAAPTAIAVEVTAPAAQSEVTAEDSSPAVVDNQVQVEEVIYPRTLRIESNTFQPHAFPLIDVIVDPYSSVDAVFTSADQLTRFESDVKQLNFLLGADDAIKVAGE